MVNVSVSLVFSLTANPEITKRCPKENSVNKSSKKDEREKPLLFKRHKVVRFLISPKNKKMKIEVNKIMNPAFLLTES